MTGGLVRDRQIKAELGEAGRRGQEGGAPAPQPRCRRPARPKQAGLADRWPSTLEHPPPPQRRPHFPTPAARADAAGPGRRQDTGRGARGAGYWSGTQTQGAGAGGPAQPHYPSQSFPIEAFGPTPESLLPTARQPSPEPQGGPRRLSHEQCRQAPQPTRFPRIESCGLEFILPL